MNNKHRISVVALVALLATVLAAGCDSEEGGPSDLGMTDGMIDTIAPDSAGPDSAAPDSAAPDSAAPDSATPDSAGPDSAMLDSALSDSSSTSCTPEGQSHAVVPGAPPCCPGLKSVGCDAPDSSGQCQGCAGATYCTDCGDGICGPSENKCRCPADCP